MKRYTDCIREDAACSSCSLSSQGMDCHGRHISKLSWLRGNAGLTQTALADALGVTYRWVQKLEYGEARMENISLGKALALADALGVDVRELLE